MERFKGNIDDSRREKKKIALALMEEIELLQEDLSAVKTRMSVIQNEIDESIGDDESTRKLRDKAKEEFEAFEKLLTIHTSLETQVNNMLEDEDENRN